MTPSFPIQVLLIDDERAFAEVLAQRLGQRGMTVTVAFDGPEALDRLDADSDLEVAVLDMAMPGMDGLQTLDRIRQKRPLLEIVMLTGHATLASAIEAMKRGAFDYLMKPCDLDLLMAKVAEAAVRKRRRESQIRDVQTTPYISNRDRAQRVAKILASD